MRADRSHIASPFSPRALSLRVLAALCLVLACVWWSPSVVAASCHEASEPDSMRVVAAPSVASFESVSLSLVSRSSLDAVMEWAADVPSRPHDCCPDQCACPATTCTGVYGMTLSMYSPAGVGRDEHIVLPVEFYASAYNSAFFKPPIFA